jgi:hypothetical protein
MTLARRPSRFKHADTLLTLLTRQVFGWDPVSGHGGLVREGYFIVAASLFNVGWAGVQVSHLALIPEITPVQHERVRKGFDTSG